MTFRIDCTVANDIMLVTSSMNVSISVLANVKNLAIFVIKREFSSQYVVVLVICTSISLNVSCQLSNP